MYSFSSLIPAELLICGSGAVGEAGKKRLRLKGWTVAANSGGTERFADTVQAFASLPASGARVADKEPEERGRWTAHVEVEGWSRFSVLFPDFSSGLQTLYREQPGAHYTRLPL